MKCKFPGCERDACGVGDLRHYCGVTHYNISKDIASGKCCVDDLKVKCAICGVFVKNNMCLTRHLAAEHNLTLKNGGLEQYYKDYLLKEGEPDGHCLWCGKPTRFTTLSNGFTKFCYNGNCSVFWHNKYKDRHKRAGKSILLTHSAGNVIPTQLGYWLKKGYSRAEARLKVRERQTTNSVQAILKRKGVSLEEALTIRKEITNKWSKKVHTGMNYSKESQDLFWAVWDNVKHKLDPNDVFFATFIKGEMAQDTTNHEYRLPTIRSYRMPDFFIKSLQLSIEFDGIFHHSDAWREATFDADRDKEILDTYPEHIILHVKEQDYFMDRNKVIVDCCNFITDRMAQYDKEKKKQVG